MRRWQSSQPQWLSALHFWLYRKRWDESALYLRLLLLTALRLRAPSPSAADPFAADAPGPPIHRVAPRGVQRCRRIASRLLSGNPATRGRLPADLGGGRGVGHFPWFASERFSDHVTGLSVVGLIGGHRAAVALVFPGVSGTSLSSGPLPAPRNTWKHVQAQGEAPEIPRRATDREWGLSRRGYGSIFGRHIRQVSGGNSLNVPHDEHSDWPLRFREFQPKLMGQVKSSLRLRQLTQCGIVVGPFQTGPVDYRNVKQALEGASNILHRLRRANNRPLPPAAHPFLAAYSWLQLRGRIPEDRKHINPLRPFFSLDT